MDHVTVSCSRDDLTFVTEGTAVKKKAIVAGHICLDITPEFPAGRKLTLNDVLRPGNVTEVREADVHTGGAVANTGLAMKILGVDVTLIAKTGRDAFGDLICSILQKYHADGGIIRSDTVSTSYSVVLAIPGVDRIFLHNPGANHTFTSDDVKTEDLREAALLHFGYPTMMRKMYSNDGEELVRLFQKAKDAGCATSLDLSAVDPRSEAGAVNWARILERVIPLTDFFLPSAEELCFMLDPDRLAEWRIRAKGKDVTEILDIQMDVKPLADICMKYGAKVLVIKCGAAGMYYQTAKDRTRMEQIGNRVHLSCEEWSGKEGFQQSFIPDRVRSGTGAGDTSIAAFLAAMLQENSLEECIQLAAATGASCVTEYDALSGLLPFDRLREKIRAGWRKNESVRDI